MEPVLEDLRPATTAVVRGAVPMAAVPMAQLRAFFDASFALLARTLGAQRVRIVSPAFALYRGMPGETLDLEVGFATDAAVRSDGGVVVGSLPGGRAGRLTHTGSYDGLGASWQQLHFWLRPQGLPGQPRRWEFYPTRPTPDMDPADLRTEPVWPIATEDAERRLPVL